MNHKHTEKSTTQKFYKKKLSENFFIIQVLKTFIKFYLKIFSIRTGVYIGASSSQSVNLGGTRVLESRDSGITVATRQQPIRIENVIVQNVARTAIDFEGETGNVQIANVQVGAVE